MEFIVIILILLLFTFFAKKFSKPYSQADAQVKRRQMIRNPSTGKQTKKGR